MEAGFTFLLRQEGTSIDSHFWIILSDPTLDAERVREIGPISREEIATHPGLIE